MRLVKDKQATFSLDSCYNCGMNKLPTQQELRKQFEYQEDTGRLKRIYHPKKNQQHLVGKIAGGRHAEGGWCVSVNGTRYLHCRIVWAYHFGDPGEMEIDHIDGDRSNDRIENLRLATRTQNQWNIGTNAQNTSGHKGVSWYKRLGKWRVDVCGRTYGYFSDLEEAIAKRLEIANSLCGEFAK